MSIGNPGYRGLGGLRGRFQQQRQMRPMQQFNPQMQQQQMQRLQQMQMQPMQQFNPQMQQRFQPQQQGWGSQARLAQEKANFAPGGKWFGTGGPGLSADTEEIASPSIQRPQFFGLPPTPNYGIGRGDVARGPQRIQGDGPGFAKPLSPQPGGGGGGGEDGGGGPPTSWKMEITPAAHGGLIPGYQGGGQVPMIYANGGYIPAYGFGGFFKGLAKGVLKAAPIAAMFTPWGAMAAAGIGAASGLLSKKLGVDQESWGDVLRGRTVDKESVGWGDAAKSGLLKGIMSGVGHKGLSSLKSGFTGRIMPGSAEYKDMLSGGFSPEEILSSTPGEGWGSITDRLAGAGGAVRKALPSAETLTRYGPAVGELASQVYPGKEKDIPAVPMHGATVSSQVMPQSAGQPQSGSSAQGYATLRELLPNTASAAMGGLIPKYEEGGEMEDEESIGEEATRSRGRSTRRQPTQAQRRAAAARQRAAQQRAAQQRAAQQRAAQMAQVVPDTIERMPVEEQPREDGGEGEEAAVQPQVEAQVEAQGAPIDWSQVEVQPVVQPQPVVDQVKDVVPKTAQQALVNSVPQDTVAPWFPPGFGGPGDGEMEDDDDELPVAPVEEPVVNRAPIDWSQQGSAIDEDIDTVGAVSDIVPHTARDAMLDAAQARTGQALPTDVVGVAQTPASQIGFDDEGSVDETEQQATQQQIGTRTIDTTTADSGPKEKKEWGQTGIPTDELDTEGLPPAGEIIYEHGREGQEDAEASTDLPPDVSRYDMIRKSAADKGMKTEADIVEKEGQHVVDIINKPEEEAKALNLEGSNLGSTQNPWAAPTQATPQSAGATTGGATGAQAPIPAAHADYRAGLMAETARSTGDGSITGYDPFNMPTSGFNPTADDFLSRMSGNAVGGPISANISTEGFIPREAAGVARVENGMATPDEELIPDDLRPDTSGRKDDRIGLMKPGIDEVDPKTEEIYDVLEWALQNPEEMAAQEVIHTAISVFGEEFVIDFIKELQKRDGVAEAEPGRNDDKLIEMDFRRRLADGDPVKVGAAIAPGEFVFTEEQTRAAGGPEALEQFAQQLDQTGQGYA